MFLNLLIEDAWLDNDFLFASQLLERFADELTEVQFHLLNEIIFGPEIKDDSEGNSEEDTVRITGWLWDRSGS